MKVISSVMNDVDLIRNPDGSKSYPALTCKDLHRSHPTFESGK